MDAGQPLVTSNGMLNYLCDHHEAYYAYIGMYIQIYILYKIIYFFNAWESIGEEMLSTYLYRSWERRCVDLIFSPDLIGDIN